MPKLSSYLTRFLILLMGCLLIVTVVTFFLSNYLSINNYSAMISEDMERALATGKQLLQAYRNGTISRAELRDSLNPTLNPSGVFLMLLDENKQAVSYTSSAAPYFSGDEIRQFLERVVSSRTTLIAARDVGTPTLFIGAPVLKNDTALGYVLVGKVMIAFDGASQSFKVGLFYGLSLILMFFVVLSVFAIRRVARPASELIHAAGDLSEGRLARVSENLPGEMGEIGRAFNHMVYALTSNINALRFEKETMALILEGLSEGIIAMDAKGTILHQNKAIRQLLPDDASYHEVLDVLTNALSGEPVSPVSGKLACGERILLYIISPLPENEKQRRGVVALVRDITEQERLERTRYDYVANISHELRTPLASMRGIAEGLRDGLVTEESEKLRYYNMIVSEILRLSRLVNDLLELSSLQSNPTAFEMERIDPAELLYELQDRSIRLFTENGRQLLLSVPDEPLQIVRSNEDRLMQVLTIFLDNALKYTPEGGHVTLMAENADTGVRFCVEDTGVGMDEETMRRAFDRFHQAERGRSDKGSGLGLSIAKEILGKLHVEIGVRSELGKGSAFYFTIPYEGK